MAAAGRDPILQEALDGCNAAGFAAEVWDRDWRLYGVSDEYRLMISLGEELPDVGEGLHIAEPRMLDLRDSWPAGPTREGIVEWFGLWAGAFASVDPGGIEAMKDGSGGHIDAMLDESETRPLPAVIAGRMEIRVADATIMNDILTVSLRDAEGNHAGAVNVVKPAVGAAVLAMLASGDERLFMRMLSLIVPAQRPGAIMFGDLESSTALARRMPSSLYFQLIRDLSIEIDKVVVDNGGVVGKHVGDGVTAFFLSETHGSDAGAARACIEAARLIQAATDGIAERAGLQPGDITVRFGLHWGASLYVGRLLTSGRLEVTALGDEVNEGARIEPCAAGGLRLASKQLIERLGPEDYAALEIDPMRLVYTPLADLEGSPEKARRDAATISVCAV
jgi:class 3 adenylate cyclase